MKKDNKTLVTFLANTCVYAQDHISTFQGSDAEKEFSMEATSHTVACFLAHNTVDGDEGVETGIIINKLVQKKKNVDYWEKVIQKLIKDFGGLK